MFLSVVPVLVMAALIVLLATLNILRNDRRHRRPQRRFHKPEVRRAFREVAGSLSLHIGPIDGVQDDPHFVVNNAAGKSVGLHEWGGSGSGSL
jgi:hypothetical protein